MSTKSKIYNRALKLFNERGIEQVGIRELAYDLNMSPGNIGYYFPRKEDLVQEVATNLRQLNTATIKLIEYEELSLITLLASLHQAFRNHVQFRCIFLGFVHIMQQYPDIVKQYLETQRFRNDTISGNIRKLIEKNVLKPATTKADIDDIIAYINLIARFWVSDALVTRSGQTDETQMAHYVRLLAMLFKPYVTEEGAEQLEDFVSSLNAS